MRQRTLGIIGAVLILAGVTLNLGSHIAAHRFGPVPALTPTGAQLQLPRHHVDGMRPGHPPSHHDRGGPLNP